MQQRNGWLVLVMVSVLACSVEQKPEGRSPAQDTTAADTGQARESSEAETVMLDTTPVQLVAADVTLAKGRHFKLQIPEGYELKVAAEGMSRLRFLCPSPDGRHVRDGHARPHG